MKKKRIFAFLLSFMFLCFCGCAMGEDGHDGYDTRALDGVKVLSKPIIDDDFFKNAVGPMASENYYNIFAYQIMANLYSVYENGTALNEVIFDLGDASEELEKTYPFEASDGNKFYLFDSLRYTITSVTTNQDASGNDKNQTIAVDFNKGWNWSVPISVYGKIIFDGFTKSGNSYITNDGEIDWTEVVLGLSQNDLPSFYEYYVGGSKELETDEDYAEYYYSPYYGGVNAGDVLLNYYQDAMEYVTYLFVLGLDYKDADGALTEENDYFEFDIDLTKTTNPMTVKKALNGQENVSVVDALAQAKDMYKKVGEYIGVTETNKEQIQNFILDKVIGVGTGVNDSPNLVEVTISKVDHNNLPVETSSKLTFNRNYDLIVNNIIDYACSQTRIGGQIGVDENDNPIYVGLDQNYRIAQITDYDGNYFFMNYFGENGGSDDTQMFKYIAPAEYQSLVLMPKAEDVENEKPLTEIILAFEYYDDPEDSFEDNSGKVFDPNGIDMNVGFRFFDYSANTITEYVVEKPINIPYGKYNEVTTNDPGDYWLVMSVTEGIGNYNIHLGDNLLLDNTKVTQTRMRGMFNQDIGGGVLNAALHGTVDEMNPGAKTILFNGSSNARNYYMTNDSQTYGTYATLKPEMFTGVDGCDYMEVFFDVLKSKDNPDKNYNFKVGYVNVAYFKRTVITY